jgi:hypothetical protein
MDIGGWLRGLGLERYDAAFRENDIDETVLASLTHETLKEIGVTTVGHRLKRASGLWSARPLLKPWGRYKRVWRWSQNCRTA